MRYIVYWSTPDGSSYGAWPSSEEAAWEKAEQSFRDKFPALVAKATDTYEAWLKAGSPQGTQQVKDRLASIPRNMTLEAAKKILEDMAPWSDKDIDDLLGLPIKRVDSAPLEANNIIRVWPLPNAWGRTK